MVLFECKLSDSGGPNQLISGPVELVINKEMIQQYIDSMDHIPHIRKITTTTLESTVGLRV